MVTRAILNHHLKNCMSLSVTTSLNDVKVYNVTPGKGIPAFLTRQEQKKFKNDTEYQKRVDVIQDLTFPTVPIRSRMSPNMQYFAAIGCYPPMLKLYDLTNVSLKFQRNTDAEIIDFQFLSNDYKKLALIQADRNVEFHAQGGKHYKVRVPKTPRCSCYDQHTPQLIIGASSVDIYRIDLQEGRFRTSWEVSNPDYGDASFGVNALAYSPESCLTFAGDSNSLTVFDARVKGGKVSSVFLDTPITALSVDATGMRIAAGLSTSDIRLYDVRSSKPFDTLSHHSDQPINTLMFHESHGVKSVLSSDNRSIRVWRLDSVDENAQAQALAKLFCVVEPESGINSFTNVPGSGLFFVATEDPVVGCYYIPQLGPAPQFASFLDELTEDLKTAARQDVYEDFRFVSREDLSALNMENIIDSKLVIPYMHGFYISKNLYEKARVVANPDSFKVQAKKSKGTDRIVKPLLRRDVPTASSAQDAGSSKRLPSDAPTDAPDDRFADLFT